MISRQTALRLLSLGFVAGAVGAAQAITIDRFTDDFPVETFYYSSGPLSFGGLEIGNLPLLPGPTYQLRSIENANQTGLPGVLGGQRFASLSQVPGSSNGSQVSVGSVGGFLDYSSAFGIRGRLSLTYDASGAGLDQNWASALPGGWVRFTAVAGDMHSGRQVPATVRLTSGLGTANEVTVGKTLFMAGLGTFNYDFSQFPGVDFTDVDRVELAFAQDTASTAAVDFSIANFQAVPEPGSLLALGVSAALVVARRRRD